jgi:pimeloyl-ACP methyl ester carboxylesterase
MNLSQLETHRRTIQTAMGPVSCLDIGEGPVTLFVHGVGTNALLWRHAISALAGERRCVAVDLPLHGHTPAAPDQDFRLSSLAAVLDAFCTAADLGEIDLVANDTGGAVSQVFAANHPERLRSLCLTNCETHDNIPPEEFKPVVELAAVGAIAAGAADLLADYPLARESLFGTSYEHINHLPIEVLRTFLQPVLGTPERAHQFEQLLVSLLPEDLLAVEPELAKLQVPTLIVWGTADVTFELSWAYWLKDLIPGATEVVEIEGGRLFFPDERSDELVSSLRQHWSTLAPAG